MATYYPNSSAQIDVLSAPYVRDQKFTSYSEPPLLHGTMMMYLNPPSSASSFSEISPNSSMNPQNEMMFIPPTSDPMSIQTIHGALNLGPGQTVGGSMNQISEQNLQGLSLSLSTQMSNAVTSASFQYQYSNQGLSSVLTSHLPLSAENSVKIDEVYGDGTNTIRFGEANNNPQYAMHTKVANGNQYQYEQGGLASTSLKCKYLKAAQMLLDEVVNVRDAIKRSESVKDQNAAVKVEEGSKECETNESTGGSGSFSQEISPAERQDFQSKLDKLHSMLDEVDRRYKQYCHQMQILTSSFDMVAGGGAAKPYTALALKTISRHFRCLRDAITNQIQATRKSLGEQDNGLGAIPRLRYVDQQLRQQRALQQFGMMRHAWRPQRGLPENAVTVLRAWLFEHFLHPYPKDSEKTMLARQSGLTRGQVANWFINARVRLWKPMVEEMYNEEFGDADINIKSPENTQKSAKEKSWGSEDRRDEMHESAPSMVHDNRDSIKTGPNPSLEANNVLHMSAFTNSENHHFYPNGGRTHLMVSPDVGGYQIPELSNFSVENNQVSLALGLRHRDDETNFQGNMIEETTMAVGTSEYPYLEQVNQQHRFSNPHILNDFVA